MVKTNRSILYLLFFLLLTPKILLTQTHKKIIGAEQQNCTLFADAGPDQTICAPGATVQLQGQISGNYCHFYWSPTTGLDHPYQSHPMATVNQSMAYTLSAIGPNPNGTNLIFNGDFEQGDVGFSSNYFWDPSGVLNEEAYFITTRGDLAKWDWQPCTDHTSSSGNMMCVNASTLGGVDVWCQTVNVQPYTDYIFSLWLVTLHPSSPAQLQFSINDQVVGEPFNASPQTCLWEENCTSWNSGINTSAEICILNLNTESWGNDFAIDDITFREACVYRDEVWIEVIDQPVISAVTELCTPANTEYQVHFEVLQGTAPFQVIGGTGIWNGAMFTSDPIPAGAPYAFQLSDASACGITLIEGAHDCVCLTDAGTLSGIATEVCEGEALLLLHNGDQFLDANDGLQYLLHDNSNGFPGTVYAQANTPEFTLLVGMSAGEWYYVTAIAGDLDSEGNVLWSSACFDQSNTMPVRFQAWPNGHLSLDQTDICLGESTALRFHLEGIPPFKVRFWDGEKLVLLEGIEDGDSYAVDPIWNTNYELRTVEDAGALVCEVQANSSALLKIHLPYSTDEIQQICAGEELFLAGDWQTTSGLYFDALQSQYGCDSLVRTQLEVLSPDSTFWQSTSCHPIDTGGQFQALSNQYGCDSLVWGQVHLLESHDIQLTEYSCDPAQTGWQQFQLINDQGCDSLVSIQTLLLPSDTTYLSAQDCDPLTTGLTFDHQVNQYGCDSLIITLTELLPSQEIWENLETCYPADTGLVIQSYTNQYGCDSLRYHYTHLLPSDWTTIQNTSCDPEEVGSTVDYLTNQYGCDSIVFTHTELLPSHQTAVFLNTCDESIVGLDSIWLINQYGCDSLVLQTTTLLSIHHCEVAGLLEGDLIYCDELSGTLTLTATIGLSPFDYVWKGLNTGQEGSGTMTQREVPIYIHDLAADQYEVIITSAAGLSTTLQAEITEEERMSVDLSVGSSYEGQDISCTGAADGVAVVRVLDGGLPPYYYEWSGGGEGAFVDGLAAGWHLVTVTDDLGCIAIDSILLVEPAPLALEWEVLDITCFGYSDGLLTLDSVWGGTAPYRFVLDEGEMQEEWLFEALSEGAHHLQVFDANGCELEAWPRIEMPGPLVASLGDDRQIRLGDSLVISLAINQAWSSIEQIHWTVGACQDCQVLRLRPLADTYIAVEIIDESACRAEDELYIQVDPNRSVFIPNAFSPNGDGHNDRLVIYGGPEVEVIRAFEVFDRWGGKQFERRNFQPNDPLAAWDGRHAGKALNPGVYVYWAEVQFIDGQILRYQGDVTLLR